MNFFKKLFQPGKELYGNQGDAWALPGRYVDNLYSPQRYSMFRDSAALFSKQEYTRALIRFLDYLYDPVQQNVHYTRQDEKVAFTLYQGRRCVRGTFDENGLTVCCQWAVCHSPETSFLREMLERNYYLQYSRFALTPQREILLKCHIAREEMAAPRLFFALKELAMKADMAGQELLETFRDADETHVSQKLVMPGKDPRTKYFKKWTTQTINHLKSLQTEKNKLPVSLVLMNWFYRTDILLGPATKVWLLMDRCIKVFSEQNKPFGPRLLAVLHFLEQLCEMDDQECRQSFYRASYTFGRLGPVSQRQVKLFAEHQLRQVAVFRNRKDEYTRALLLENTAGYSLFGMGLHKPTRQLLAMVYQVLYPEFFRDIRYGKPLVSISTGMLYEKNIRQAIAHIVKQGQKEFPRLRMYTHMLSFAGKNAFLESFLREISQLDYGDTTPNI